MNLYDCVVFTAHPDDAFLNMGGTIASLASANKKVLVVSASCGENRDASLGMIRSNEFDAAIQFFKIDGKILDFPDGEMAFCKKEITKTFLNILTATNPKIVITHHMEDIHTDHRSVYESCTLSIELLWHSLKENARLKYYLSFSPSSLNLCRLSSLKFNIMHDISSFSDKKKTAILLNESQMPYIEKNLYQHRCLDKLLGAFAQCEFAEGFYLNYPIGKDSNTIFGL